MAETKTGLCWHVRYRGKSVSTAESSLTCLMSLLLSNRKHLSSRVSPSSLFLPLQIWPLTFGNRCGGLMGGKNVRLVMGTRVLFDLWLVLSLLFCLRSFLRGLGGLFLECLGESWRGCKAGSLRRPSTSSWMCDVLPCVPLNTGASQTAESLSGSTCWFNGMDFLRLWWRSILRSLPCPPVTGGVGSAGGDLGLLSDPVCGRLDFVWVRSMQLSGATLSQPETWSKEGCWSILGLSNHYKCLT